jgi:glycerol-3-phosphate O-acyltransferase/dihydroxyacetone phosphate acyltransferase
VSRLRICCSTERNCSDVLIWTSEYTFVEALAASTVKIAGRDVLATWKVLVALAGAPSLYTVYAINAVVLAHKLGLPYKYKVLAPVATFAGLPVIGFAALRFGEVGMDVYK